MPIFDTYVSHSSIHQFHWGITNSEKTATTGEQKSLDTRSHYRCTASVEYDPTLARYLACRTQRF